MTEPERRRLARILGMLGSEHAGERASAALQAEAFRKRHGMTWEQMLALPPVETAPERPKPDEPSTNVYADRARRAREAAERVRATEAARKGAEEAAKPLPPEPVMAREWIKVVRPPQPIGKIIFVGFFWLVVFSTALRPITIYYGLEDSPFRAAAKTGSTVVAE